MHLYQVDIDQALTRIDKLLKSQELTFAFVRVAHASGIVHLLRGSLITLVQSTGRGKYGRTRKKAAALSAVRYVLSP